jgi:soluble epoxide hydrolase/lipid-phosphate phosphatase
VESLFFTTDNEINKKYKGAPGGFRTWLTEGKTADLPAFLTSEVKLLAVMHGVSRLAYMEQDHKHYQHAFSFEKGGYGPGINWYRASLRNINEEDEKSTYHFPLYSVSPFLSHSTSSPETCSLSATIFASY